MLKKQMSDEQKNALTYIQQHESTSVSYVKVGNSAKNLVVSFAGNAHSGFARKSSLMQLKYQRNDFDVIYFRNKDKWYLGGLNGIGKNINHTIAFLKTEFAKYNKVICTGVSAGGYASLLFGSLLSVDLVFAGSPQTDLDYLLKYPVTKRRSHSLLKRRKECSATWKKYSNLSSIICKDVDYYVAVRGDKNTSTCRDLILHGEYHLDNIIGHINVHVLKTENELFPKLIENLK